MNKLREAIQQAERRIAELRAHCHLTHNEQQTHQKSARDARDALYAIIERINHGHDSDQLLADIEKLEMQANHALDQAECAQHTLAETLVKLAAVERTKATLVASLGWRNLENERQRRANGGPYGDSSKQQRRQQKGGSRKGEGTANGTSSSRHEAYTSQRKGPDQPPPKVTQAHYTVWWEGVNRAFTDLRAIDEFPQPPVRGFCSRAGCQAVTDQKVLLGCECDIEAAFQAINCSLKAERNRWHPDRFAACKEEHRDRFTLMASEVFKVVNRMYEELAWAAGLQGCRV